MKHDIKFFYIKDEKNPNHVLCISRKIISKVVGENGEVTKIDFKYGWSLNNFNAGDVFDKKLARKIAEGRVNSERRKNFVTVSVNEFSVKAICEDMLKLEDKNFPKVGRRLLTDFLADPAVAFARTNSVERV